MKAPPTRELDAAGWVHRWNLQQGLHVPDRDATFGLMLDVLERLDAAPGRLLDLGCGPGSLAARVLARFPDAEVIGLDLDPVLLELARRTLGDRVRWLRADLRRPDWAAMLGGAVLDAVVSATALHWLAPEQVDALAVALAAHLRPGGVFANCDTMPIDPSNPRLAALAQQLRPAADPTAEAPENWDVWWAALGQEPELTELLAERARLFGSAPRRTAITLNGFDAALRAAGFAEVATLRQVADRCLLVAVR